VLAELNYARPGRILDPEELRDHHHGHLEHGKRGLQNCLLLAGTADEFQHKTIAWSMANM
jgi:hypothetical protein